MLKGITKREIEILDIIDEHVNLKGYPPSYREIAKE